MNQKEIAKREAEAARLRGEAEARLLRPIIDRLFKIMEDRGLISKTPDQSP